MSSGTSECIHVKAMGIWSWAEIKARQKDGCHSCGDSKINLWLCLIGQCQYVGCGELSGDHSTVHSKEKHHCLTINLTTLRIWCYLCEAELFPNANHPPCNITDEPTTAQTTATNTTTTTHQKIPGSSTESSPSRSFTGGDDTDSDYDDRTVKPRGLTGLQNLGNTCYMNAAVQALSHCPPLTRFFLDCYGFVKSDKSPMLSRHYMRLITEMWHKKRPSYVVPTGVANGIKVVHPMFRGYTQQDTQEFLRCFMDQLHEELKYKVYETEDSDMDMVPQTITSTGSLKSPASTDISHERQPSIDSSSSCSQSDADYETCDSGLSSDRSSAEPGVSSDDGSDANENSHLNPGLMKSKQAKDSANLRQKRGNHFSDEAEFCDAASDSELTQRKKVDSRNMSTARSRHLSDSDVVLQRQSVPVHVPSHTSTAKRRSVRHHSIISDVFDGKILSSVQCLTCERVSITKETFQDLSLPIPNKDHIYMLHASQAAGAAVNKGGACGEGNQNWISWIMTWMKSWFVGPTITLQDCLAAFFSADELKGDNMYSCEKCQKLRNGIKFSKVLELPEILCIHLKRFRHEFLFSTKICSSVVFPFEGLDMGPYLHRDCKSEITVYDLTAVICHHGNAGGGHYTSYCLNHLNEQWYEFDDQYVTEEDIQTIADADSEAYVLFYRKRNYEMMNLRQKALELMETREPSLMHFYVSKQWINRFNTFAEPGPIDNRDFLCQHGGVHPDKVSLMDELTVQLQQPLWQFLHERFGGGPVCNHLFACKTCQQELELLRHRQKTEKKTFIQLNEKFRDENPTTIYALSTSWFKHWENFVKDKTEELPGPIDNTGIAMNKGGQLLVKLSSDYCQISEDMWQFLLRIYGGGPELILHQNIPVSQAPARFQQGAAKPETHVSEASSNSNTTPESSVVTSQNTNVTSQTVITSQSANVTSQASAVTPCSVISTQSSVKPKSSECINEEKISTLECLEKGHTSETSDDETQTMNVVRVLSVTSQTDDSLSEPMTSPTETVTSPTKPVTSPTKPVTSPEMVTQSQNSEIVEEDLKIEDVEEKES